MPASIPVSVNPGYEKDAYKKLNGQEKSELGRDQFLRILITQLQYQDPMQPLQDKESIAQMAQFSSVEALATMSQEFTSFRNSLGNASMLIDKQVSWMEYDSEQGKWITETGVVDSIIMKDKIPYAVVGEKQIAIDDISSVQSPTTSNSEVNG